jgi:phytoene dehydrogenase-like protein
VARAQSWIVFGGGFRGIAAALLLRRAGQEVTLVERGKDVGGVMSAVKWKDFWFDKGCHLFANTSDEATELLLEMLGGRIVPVEVQYASVTNGRKTDGIAIPDLSSAGPEAEARIQRELLAQARAAPGPAPASMAEALAQRFGATAAALLRPAAAKMYQCDPAALDADAMLLGMFSRIKFTDDATGRRLKQTPELDARVAVSSSRDPMEFYRAQARAHTFRNFYPDRHGLAGFCEAALAALEAAGVTVRLGVALERLELEGARPAAILADGTRLEADRVFWAAGLDTFCKQTGHPVDIARLVWQVPMVMHYFVIRKEQEGPYSYVHDFDHGDRLFRASLPGRYGRDNCPPGYSYVCCEVPTLEGSPTWADAKGTAPGVYAELARWGIVAGGEPQDTVTLTLKATYRVPRAGFAAARQEVLASLPPGRVAGLREHDFAKTDIVKSVRQELERHLAG